jgi:hypothetical protein
MKPPEKIQCEVCKEKDKCTLQIHHIIPRTDPDCTNHPYNLAVLCSNCHNKVHLGNLNVLGVLPSTDVGGRTLIYELDGIRNIDVEIPPIPKPKQIKVSYE